MPVPRIVECIQKHRVLISSNNKDSFEVSSGTLVRIEDKTFVFTAQHNLSQLSKRKLFINLGIPYQDCSFMIKKIWSDENLDISYMELDTAVAEKYRKGIEPVVLLQRGKSTDIAPQYRAAAIIGYPFKHVTLFEQCKTYDVETIFILSQVVQHDNWPKSIDKEKAKWMLIEYGPHHGQTFFDQNDKPIESHIHPGGLSGSAIWKFNPETMHSENPEYALWGIQNCWFEKNQVLCGTFIEPLIDRISSDYSFSL